MSNKKKIDPQWVVKASSDTDGNEARYEQVGEKLVSTDFIDDLIEHVDGKVVASPFVISIPELVDDDFLNCNVQSLRAVMVECLIKLIDTNRIVIDLEE